MTENNFDALLTFDKNIAYQQNFSRYSIAVIVIHAPENSYNTIQGYVNKIKEKLKGGLKEGIVEIRN